MSLLGSFPRSTSTTSLYTRTAIGSVMTVLCPQSIAHPIRQSHSSHRPTRSQHLHQPHQPHHAHHAHHTRQLHQSHRPQHTPQHSQDTQQLQKRACRQTRSHHTRPRHSSLALSSQSAEDIFLQALARASLCRKHARPHSTHSRPHLRPSHTRRASPDHEAAQLSSSFSTSRGSRDAVQAVAAISRDELRDLVNLYDYETEVWDPPKAQKRRTPLRVPVEDIPPTHDHYRVDPMSRESAPPKNPPPDLEQHADQIRHVVRLLKDPLTPHRALFEAYQALPHPRISYFSDHHIRNIMHHFSVVEYKDEQSMLRYLSLVDDMAAAEIPLTTGQWNSAIAFAGRWVREVTDLQVETATQIWLRMEREAGVKSDNVTFNILFDIAVKSGKFALAETIMKEMMTREMPENRFFLTNKIYYYGIKRDGAAVRRAYKELVDAGEFVDTAVLNCVIASLIRAGEASAAEHIFHRMKSIHAESTGSKPVTGGWRKRRDLGRVLARAAQSLRNDPERRLKVQEVTPITPDLHTYRLLIKYHSHESGNIDRVTDLLDEMHEMHMHIHGSVFYQLLKGFQLHGGVRYSSWTKSRLDQLWSVFLELVQQTETYNSSHTAPVDEEDRGCYYDIGVVTQVLRAYNKVSGKDSAMGVWEDILERWKPEEKTQDAINGVLANMFDKRQE